MSIFVPNLRSPSEQAMRRIFHFELLDLEFVLYHAEVSSKSARIAELIDACRGQELDARYLGFFECFNRGLFYEAHDVLEELWLGERQRSSGAFYKGLIQLAGAFVHLRKDRLRPAAALFKLTRANLRNYPANYQCLDVAGVLILVEDWLHRLEASNYSASPLTPVNHPILKLSR